MTYCNLISGMTTASFLQVPCNCQSCYFLDIWLLQARNHSTIPSRYNWECGRTRLWRAGGSADRWKTPSLIFAALIAGNFSVRQIDARLVSSIAVTKFLYSPSSMRREGSKMLRDSTSSRVPVIVEKASSSSFNKKSLLDCLFHTRNSKILCSPSLPIRIEWSKQYGNNFEVSAKLYAFQKKLHVVILLLRLLLSLPKNCCHISPTTSATFTS